MIGEHCALFFIYSCYADTIPFDCYSYCWEIVWYRYWCIGSVIWWCWRNLEILTWYSTDTFIDCCCYSVTLMCLLLLFLDARKFCDDDIHYSIALLLLEEIRCRHSVVIVVLMHIIAVLKLLCCCVPWKLRLCCLMIIYCYVHSVVVPVMMTVTFTFLKWWCLEVPCLKWLYSCLFDTFVVDSLLFIFDDCLPLFSLLLLVVEFVLHCVPFDMMKKFVIYKFHYIPVGGKWWHLIPCGMFFVSKWYYGDIAPVTWYIILMLLHSVWYVYPIYYVLFLSSIVWLVLYCCSLEGDCCWLLLLIFGYICWPLFDVVDTGDDCSLLRYLLHLLLLRYDVMMEHSVDPFCLVDVCVYCTIVTCWCSLYYDIQ